MTRYLTFARPAILILTWALTVVSQETDALPKPGSIVFGRDIAPVLVANCLECHDDARKRGGLSMTTMAKLKAGGDSGPAIVPGQTDASMVIRKIRGEDPPRMPQNRPPLAESTIDSIVAWIAAGARLDDAQADADSLERLAWDPRRIAADRLGRLTPTERDKAERDELARLMGRVRPTETETDARTLQVSDHFAVIGIAEAKVAKSLLESLEKVRDELRPILGERAIGLGDSSGRILVVVFVKPAEFAEFCRQNGFESQADDQPVVGRFEAAWPLLGVLVEPEGLAAPTAIDPEKATGRAVARGGRRKSASRKVASAVSVRPAEGLAAEAVTIAAFDAFPSSPAWLRSGLASSLSKSFEKDRTAFDSLAAEARAVGPGKATSDWPRRADEFLKDRLPPHVMRPLAFSLVDWLRGDQPQKFPAFVQALSAGEQELDKTLAALWKIDRPTFLARWTRTLIRGPARKGR